MTIRVCIAGATGWAGSALTRAVHQAGDMLLSGAISRSKHGKTIQEVLDLSGAGVVITGSVNEALQTGCDVMVEFTKPDVAKQNILYALDSGVHVVVGTSGLSDEDYAEIHEKAMDKQLGVLAAGNFALTVVLLQKFARIAAAYIPHWEIIDYAGSGKVDVPSGTALELANQLGNIRESQLDIPADKLHGPKETRGARLNGSQVHSIRLPGYVISVETIFGMDDQKLVLRHEAGSSAMPYVDGAMLAIRKVNTFNGLKRGLDTIMDI
ncbi:MAG: 4-hydroxy-tetrahydrodipicolinate reductase [Desulfatirhabdiaceae bacterium]